MVVLWVCDGVMFASLARERCCMEALSGLSGELLDYSFYLVNPNGVTIQNGVEIWMFERMKSMIQICVARKVIGYKMIVMLTTNDLSGHNQKKLVMMSETKAWAWVNGGAWACTDERDATNRWYASIRVWNMGVLSEKVARFGAD